MLPFVGSPCEFFLRVSSAIRASMAAKSRFSYGFAAVLPGSAFGFCDHHSASLAFCRGELRDASGRLLAQSMGTFRRMREGQRLDLQPTDPPVGPAAGPAVGPAA